jgi:8-oxo-dGTP pyrophosphatase MutT (NUDIX family)
VNEEDIAWTDTAGSFKYRSAGVVRDGDRLLLCAVEDIDGWFLPGGKVQFGEDSADALVRELREELKIDADVGDTPLLITESIRYEEGQLHQEVCFYYAVPWPEGLPSESVDELSDHSYCWVRLVNLDSTHFLPPQIAGVLMEESSEVRHRAFDRRRQ